MNARIMGGISDCPDRGRGIAIPAFQSTASRARNHRPRPVHIPVVNGIAEQDSVPGRVEIDEVGHRSALEAADLRAEAAGLRALPSRQPIKTVREGVGGRISA